MKSIYYLLIGLLFVVSACEDDKDKSDYDVQGNGVPTGVTTATVQAVTMVSAEFSGSVEGNKIYIDDNFGALIIVGANAGLFHSVYGENVIE